MNNEILKKYHGHKRTAKLRGIDWQFTPDTWYNVWVQSGKWDLRGRGKGKYCMSRINDIGPYSPSNVYINDFAINSHEGQIGKIHSEERKKKNSIAHLGNTWNKGRKLSIETKKKMSDAKKGKAPWNKDFTHMV